MADPKYTADDLKDMVDKGTAMKNANGDPSYPVADKEDIENAVKAVGRGGADHDAIRKHVMAGAKALKLTDLIPDTWQADGSLKTAETKSSAVAPETREQRAEQSLSFGDTQSLLYSAIVAALPFGRGDIWISDCGSDWVVWMNYDEGGYFRVGYSIDPDTNEVAFDGQPMAVAEMTTYVPVAGAQTLSGEPDGETRAAKKVTCPTCDGDGTIREGNMECPDCDGTGKVVPDTAEAASDRPRRQRRQRRDLERGAERRTFAAKIEVRSASLDGDEAVLHGMPIRYDARYDVRDMLGSFRETMKPGVLDAVLGRELDCRFLVNHDGVPHARTTNSTLVLTDSPTGVISEAHVDLRRSDSRDLALAIERGDVTQMSCGFVVAKGGDEWTLGADGIEDRNVFSFAELFDVSAVTYPASPTTSIEVAVRALARLDDESRERIRRLWNIAKDIRAGKALSQQNGQDLADALEALHEADIVDIPGIVKQLQAIDKAAVDLGQAGISAVLDRADPDGTAKDQEPALEPPPAKDDRALQMQRLRLGRLRYLRDAA